jgi:ABC-2 type transport system ATP-binding protein
MVVNGAGAIRVRGLTKRFRIRRGLPVFTTWGSAHWLLSLFMKATAAEERFTAVDRLDLDVAPGEFLGLLGPNGAGKTTLMKCLSTLLIPEEGALCVNGFDVLRQPDEVKRSITLIGGRRWIAFDMGLTVRENLEFFGHLYGLQGRVLRERIAESLEIVELTSHMNASPRHLSSGQRQRLVLAKGFLVHTPVFFLDEPTANLDPRGIRDVLDYLKDKLSARKGITFILTTHHTNEAEELCGRVAIMNRGRIVALDTPANLKRLVSGRQLIEVHADGDLEPAAARLRREDGVFGAAVTPGPVESAASFMRVQCEDAEAVAPVVIAAVREAGAVVRAIVPVAPSLEDVFVAVTGEGGLYSDTRSRGA